MLLRDILLGMKEHDKVEDGRQEGGSGKWQLGMDSLIYSRDFKSSYYVRPCGKSHKSSITGT